jgi:hypothetical protein
MTIVLSAALPPGEHNGLETLADVLIGHPRQGHLVLAVVNCKQTTTNSSTGNIVATAQIVDIESFAYGTNHWEELRSMMDERRERRTGQVPLPLATEVQNE